VAGELASLALRTERRRGV